MSSRPETVSGPPERVDNVDPTTFPYLPLDPTVNGTRLLILEPASEIASPITCRLEHIAFDYSPQYEALSYTWGPDAPRCTITLEDHPITVGQNLHTALLYLRDPTRPRALWVDALCVNQSDIPEKNHQVSMMPFIYSRAENVCIWLGIPSPASQHRFPPGLWERVFGIGGELRVRERMHQDFSKELCDNPYWKRVWIIQEIGLARKLSVHYAQHTVGWTRFVRILRLQRALTGSVPVRLFRQIQEKDEDGQKLQKLIEKYRGNLCKESRDHVYGFLGLANDGYGVEAAYEKSLYEVWKDVVRWKNGLAEMEDWDGEGSQVDVLRFARLVWKLLCGDGLSESENILTKEALERDLKTAAEMENDEDDPPDIEADYRTMGGPNEVLITTRISGKIVGFGPPYSQLMSNSNANKTWKSVIKKLIRRWDVPVTFEENDLFLEVLERAGAEDLEIVHTFERVLKWCFIDSSSSIWQCDANSIRQDGRALVARPSRTDEPRLFVLGGVKAYGDASSGRVGLAPKGAMVGDYIALIDGVEKALVIRREDDILRIVGTAAMGENGCRALIEKQNEVPREKAFGTADFEFVDSPDRLDVFVDIGTAFELMG